MKEKDLKKIHQKIIKSLPKKTGVYQLKDEKGNIIYIGKAVNIQERIKNHLSGQYTSPRAKKLAENTVNVDFIETSNEPEALVLENNLIKELQPKYNILLRDDKTFQFIKFTVQEDFPRLLLVRRITNDGAKYFGPKTSSNSAKKTIDMLQGLFKFRTCRLEIKEKNGEIGIKKQSAQKIPCLEYHIKHCEAPCIGNINKEQYQKNVKTAMRFLSGQTGDILKQIKADMMKSAENKNFEEAAQKRDLMLAVENISEKQFAADASGFSADVLGLIEKFDQAFFHLFQIRDGRIIGSEDFVIPLGENLFESLSAFLRNYPEKTQEIPKIIVLDPEILSAKEKAGWEDYLKTEIVLPQKGKKKSLLDLAKKNAENYARKNAPSFMKKEKNHDEELKELQKKLSLKDIPKRIEAYDISHLSGTETVGSMVVFVNGEAEKAHYRKFKIKTLEKGKIDDFSAIEEVISRRFQKLPQPLLKGFSIRKAGKKDFEEIKKELKNKKLKPDNFYVLKKEKKIAGFVQEKIFEKENIHLITDLFIFPKFRGKKLSDFLVRHVLNKTKAKKIYKLASFGQKSIEYLEKLGFEHIRKTPEVFIKQVCSLKERDCDNSNPYMVHVKKKKDASFNALPDLILIDGGKGQLSSALKAFKKFDLNVPFCSLAKKEEEVFVENKKTPVNIAKNSPAGHLLQNIRDEAHRFAISFNRNLREKNSKKSALDSVPGIGSAKRKILLQNFGNVAGIRSANDEEIENLIGKKGLIAIRENL